MSVLADVDVLLRTPETRVLAMDPQGARTVALPDSLDTSLATTMVCSGPLDPIAPQYHGKAVAAFESATRRGHGSALVGLIDHDVTHRLHIFDLEQTHGCFIAIAIPDDVEVTGSQASASLAPRQSSFKTNASGVFLSVGPNVPLMLGWEAEELIGRSVLDLVHPDDHENAIVGWIQLLENPTKPCGVRQRLLTKSGEWMWCDSTDLNHLDDETDPHVITEVIDVSRELASQAALQRRETLFDRLTQALPSGVLQLDANGTAEIWNDRWPELTGSDPQSGIDGLFIQLVEVDEVRSAVDRAIANGTDADLEVSFTNAAGACQFGNLHLRPLRQDDVHSGLLLTLDDVTRLRTYQHELAEQAQRDPLTGVLNRFGLESAVEAQLETAAGDPQSELAVLFLDLNRFKTINDAHGHATGDAVLCHVASAVAQQLRPDDVFGRLGGDEFLVTMICDDAAEQSATITDRICKAVTAIGDTMGHDITVGATIGSATAMPKDDFDSVIRRADEAMYAQKRAARERQNR